MEEEQKKMEWKQKFDLETLKRGRDSWKNHRVSELKKVSGGYTAAVLTRQRYEVSIGIRDEKIVRMRCSCPAAKGGRNCEHMAAVLYAIEGKDEPEQNEEKIATMNRQLTEEERKARKEAREARKADIARKKEEQKQKATAERQKEYEKRRAEEERREKIRQQKEEEARIRAQKRAREQEEARRLAEERRREEERKAEEGRRKRLEAKLRAEERRKAEEERMRREAEEQHRLEEERKAEKRRMEEERKRKEQERYQTEFALLGGPAAEEDMRDAADRSANIKALESYAYFDGKSIRNSIDIAQDVFCRGEQLIREGRLTFAYIYHGFDRGSGDILGQIDADGNDGKQKFNVQLIFSRTEIKRAYCECPQCRRDYYSNWYPTQTSCPYKAGTIKLLEDYLGTHNFGDATDQKGNLLMQLYRGRRASQIMADTERKEASLSFYPRLTKKNGELSVSFKIGEGKMFVVKKLDEFCANVQSSATNTYGSSTQINHDPGNFTEKGRKWIRFVSRIVREEEEFQARLLESRDYYGYQKKGVGGSLELFGWRLDEFYHLMENETVEYEDKDGSGKKKGILTSAECNPKVTMQIFPEKSNQGGTFEGIRAEVVLPELYLGTDSAYYIADGHLCRVEREFQDKIEPLAELTEDGQFGFQVGRNNLSEFYYRIMPQFEEVVDIIETDPDEIRRYLLPDVTFVFYLDAAAQGASCRVNARYGEKEVSALDVLLDQKIGNLESFRDEEREQEILYLIKPWFPKYDQEREVLFCDEEEQLYQLLNGGTEKLMELGEVRCTKNFLGIHAVRHMKLSVGVSVSSGLLDLEIATEDIPASELLDILGSYRTRKKYYRLKDGSFVNLEDSSVEMLAEMMEAMHLKPKEFAKGKMHLPMYRTLYLDKMLEEHEDVYSSRDSHFREVVKGFKTVKDADYEEPASLSKIMRKYQKNGYKWLRTLEAWQFGGILADDMGLGKTLQIIAVLLAAKEEGRGGTSLVVAPAALVFNWGEECTRFAPELNVLLVTGTQEERREKIEEYRNYDVLVTSYDLLKRDIACYEDKEFLYEVIDEAQYIKNHTTAAAKAVKVIRSRIRYALTGTPIENRLSELWSIFDYLMPGFLYGYDVFKREIETPVVKNHDEAAMQRLQKMVGPFILRRLKQDVLKDLPEKLEESRYVRFGNEQQKLYDAQVVHMKETIARQDAAEFHKNKLQILAELTRLRQICCDPSLCFENYRGEAAKLEACLQLIQSAIDGGHRMLVFSQFTSMLEILKTKLDEERIAYYTIVGSTPKEKRLQMVKEFNEGEVPVFLISLKAGGVGLNLTGADVVIHYDPWWNLAVQNQATDRAHRIGQNKKVTVYKLIVKGTIEEKIEKLQETKKDLAEQVIGGETGQLGSMSKEELLELLGVEA